MARLAMAIVIALATLFAVPGLSAAPEPAALSVSQHASWLPRTDTGPAVDYSAPIAGPVRVVRGFDPPATPYGPGHLGVDLRVRAAAPVLAAGAGLVRFAGAVAGRGVIVIEHADGISTEYEPAQPLVHAGDAVARGQPIGVLHGSHPGCPGSCLHWGARRAGAYIDPLSLLRRLGVVRLLPWPGPAP